MVKGQRLQRERDKVKVQLWVMQPLCNLANEVVPNRDPQGLLAPLDQGLRGDVRALQAEQGQVERLGQVRTGDQGGRALVNDGSMARRGMENFKLEIRKLRGETGADSRSYHSASSGGERGVPPAAQGDRAASAATTTPLRGNGHGLAAMSTSVQDCGGAGTSGTPGQGVPSSWIGSTWWIPWCWCSRWVGRGSEKV